MLVRGFKPSDIDELATLFHASVHEVGIRDYSFQQVSAWSPVRPCADRYLKQAENGTFLVAVDEDGMIAGYGNVESKGYIDHLYCRPDVVGTGIGSAIYLALEDAAKNTAINRLFVDASEGARRLFERHGFTVEARNELRINGIAIHNYRMSKVIA